MNVLINQLVEERVLKPGGSWKNEKKLHSQLIRVSFTPQSAQLPW